MTKDTPPFHGIAWEPRPEGVAVSFARDNIRLLFPMPEVRELANDMEEANQLSRGYEKHEIEVQEVLPLDRFLVGGNHFIVASTLREGNPNKFVLQDKEGSEVILPPEDLITIYRKIE